MKLHSIIILILLSSIITVKSQDTIRLTLSAPNTVVLDKPFQLVYTLNATGGVKLQVPALKNFERLNGPFESNSSSYQIINGKSTSSVSFSYSYTIKSLKTGIFIIPAATITVNNQRIKSKEVTVKVIDSQIIDLNKTPKNQVQSNHKNTDIHSNYDFKNILEVLLWLTGFVILILFIIFSTYLFSTPINNYKKGQDELEKYNVENKVFIKTNFFSIMFWVLTPSFIAHFFILQLPIILPFGFWGIMGGVFIFSIIPTVLWILSKKYENKKKTLNKLFINVAGYFFIILSVIISLFYLIGSFAALIVKTQK